jgi:hypothetical protein
VGSLETKLDGIQGGVGDLRAAVEQCNRGVALLCHVVAESFFQYVSLVFGLLLMFLNGLLLFFGLG